MKHKAQESLDTLECRVYTADGEICDINLQLGRCNGCDFKGALKDIQNLINCQFTLEEIELIQIGLLHIKDYEKPIYRNIKRKIIKQKEMWEED